MFQLEALSCLCIICKAYFSLLCISRSMKSMLNFTIGKPVVTNTYYHKDYTIILLNLIKPHPNVTTYLQNEVSDNS